MMEPTTIVLVEDDDGHAALVQRNLARAGVANPLLRLSHGQAALDYFQGRGRRPGEELPETLVVLLDIKMPGVDGVEVLRRLKSDDATSTIPVIMLTTTDDPREVERCYELGCNLYITKPVEYEAFVEAIRRLGFLLQVVKVPHSPATEGRPA